MVLRSIMALLQVARRIDQWAQTRLSIDVDSATPGESAAEAERQRVGRCADD
jgi:hypothetical protein